MSSPTEQPAATSPISQPTTTPETTLIALNIISQINEKLKPSTFPQWRAQFEALLIGYNLLDYVQGVSQCPSPAGTSSSELNKTYWVRQDKLILSAILASTSPTITPLIATAKTSHEAWEKLHHMYASKSRTRVMQLKEELTLIQRKNRSIPDYLHAVKALADEIALIDHPISDDDLTLYILNGLDSDYKDIATTIRARATSLAFEELHDLLVGHDGYLRRLESSVQPLLAYSVLPYFLTATRKRGHVYILVKFFFSTNIMNMSKLEKRAPIILLAFSFYSSFKKKSRMSNGNSDRTI